MPSSRFLLAAASSLALLGLTAPSMASVSAAESVVIQQDVNAALAALGLDQQGATTWARRTVDGDRVVFTNLAITSETGAVAGERVIIEGLRLAGAAPVFDSLVFENGTMDLPDAEEPATFERLSLRDPSAELIDGLSRQFRGQVQENGSPIADGAYGEFSMAGFGAALAVDGDAFVYTLRDLTVIGYDGTTIDQIMLSDFRMIGAVSDGTSIDMTVDSIRASGLTVGEEALNMQMDTIMAGALKPNQMYESTVISGVNLSGEGIEMSMPRAELTGNSTNGGGFQIDVDVPSFVLAFDESAGNDAAAMLEQLDRIGLENFDFSLNGSFQFDPDGERLYTVDDMVLSGVGLARFSFGFDVEGFMAYSEALEAWEAEQLVAKPGVEPQVPSEISDLLTLRSVSLGVEDLGLLDLVFSIMAEEQGVSAEQMRQQAGVMAALFTMGAAAQMPKDLGEDLQEALIGFIARGGAVRIAVEPPEPLSLAEMEGLGATPNYDALGMSIEHSAP